MSNWEQISWCNAKGKIVFDDELGFGRVGDILSASIGNYDLSQYYELNTDNGHKEQLKIDISKPKALKSLFSKKLFLRNRNYGYYGYGNNVQEYLEITVEEITVSFSFGSINRNRNYGYYDANRQYTLIINKKDKSRLDYLRHVWICDEIQDEGFNAEKYLKRPLLKDLMEGEEILYNGKKCLIVKVYEQPNVNGYMLSVVQSCEGASSEIINVVFTDTVYALPYKERIASEMEQFNYCINEFALSPYAVKNNLTINVYWDKVEDAAQYNVSLYKYFDRPYLKKIYHLKDYIVDRNDGFVVINDLVDKGYIVTVRAESRSGDVIACSRGIKISESGQCVSQYFEED